MEAWTRLPGPVSEQLSPLALEVTADAVSDYDRALELQNWFRSEFEYSLDTAAGNDTEALAQFLAGSRAATASSSPPAWR